MFWGAAASRGDSCSNYVSVELTAPKYEIGKMYSTFLTVGGWNNANMEPDPGNSIINCCLVLRGESAKLVNPGTQYSTVLDIPQAASSVLPV